MSQLTIPPFFNPKNAADWGYTPDTAEIAATAAQWAADFGIQPAAADRGSHYLVPIDLQGDFTNPAGSLYVGGLSGTGAIDDCNRIAKLVYGNIDVITHIVPTMDTHMILQIFFPMFWVDSTGSNPPPHTIITVDDIRRGVWQPSPATVQLNPTGGYAWVAKYVEHYCQTLEDAGKYTLYIWPYHCLLGSVGHTLNGTVLEAFQFHGFARGRQLTPEIKGTSPFTENYSVFGPEVELSHDNLPVGQRNTRIIDTLLRADSVTFLGEAASHCVSSSIGDMLDVIMEHDPDLVRKCYVVEDCMSPVVVPDGNGGFISNFSDDADRAIQRFRDAGMHVVQSTTPMRDWPDFKA